jgi:hypothetical protein
MIHRIRAVGRDLHLEDSVFAVAGNTLDRNARERKFVGQTRIVNREVNELAQPLRRDFHERMVELTSHPCNQRLTAGDGLPKLLKKPYIALKEQLDIIHAILHNRNPLDAHAKSES